VQAPPRRTVFALRLFVSSSLRLFVSSLDIHTCAHKRGRPNAPPNGFSRFFSFENHCLKPTLPSAHDHLCARKRGRDPCL
jgi:hypothetical protein